ncbi:aryl-alcohol oxidase-like protein [Crucibulum laeve]|uniref:pyranose dehydrogenase (acceptor) n=1 Tax=Crucibulum laeve TaxID=68775 RepID=A0A5C3LXT6_9AGAR|nr:aryl-alcohol oxidase-like protein [Crucibulum laeve]
MKKGLHQVSLLCALFGTSFGLLLTDPSQVQNTTYDFIVVGAGTAGNVIAARLTENPSTRVLVIEAGGSNTGPNSQNIQVPLFAPQASLPNTRFDWNYTTIPQKALNNQVLAYARGFVLGGSSSTNLMTWTRGSRDDFDRFAQVIGDSSYSWDNMVQFFKKSEQWVHPRDGRNDSDEFNPAVHGNGPVLITTEGVTSVIDDRVLATTQQLPAEFPFNLDSNSGDLLGVAWLQSSMGGGSRSSSATAYLAPVLNSRQNLDVLIQTRATKLIQSGSSQGLPQFNTLEVGQTSSSKRFTFTARKEIILSAGAVGTPQILMLSGIGNPSDLAKLGINSTVSLPDVGKNLIDQPIVSAQYIVPNDTATLDPITLGEDPNAAAAALSQWNANKTGPLTSAGSSHIGFFRLPNNSTLLQNGDPSAGPSSSHYELAWQPEWAGAQTPPTSGRYVSNIHVVTTPTSRGSITLNSSNPFTAPIIDPNFFATDYDLGVMVAAIRSALRFIKAKPWNGFVLAPVPGFATVFADNSSDADVVTYIRQFTRSIHHTAGTAAANKEQGSGVVDANLLLKNATGVRIVDASVFPFLPSAHPIAGVYGFAELLAQKIKTAYNI